MYRVNNATVCATSNVNEHTCRSVLIDGRSVAVKAHREKALDDVVDRDDGEQQYAQM